MFARRYLHTYGATSEDFGRVAVADRKCAATSPNAWFYQRPTTLADHQASRWVTEPLRLLDCCQESDGGVAIVVTSRDRAADLRHSPAVVAAAQGSGADQFTMTSYYREDLAALPERATMRCQQDAPHLMQMRPPPPCLGTGAWQPPCGHSSILVMCGGLSRSVTWPPNCADLARNTPTLMVRSRSSYSRSSRRPRSRRRKGADGRLPGGNSGTRSGHGQWRCGSPGCARPRFNRSGRRVIPGVGIAGDRAGRPGRRC